jgi:hypothetical protein
MRAAQACLARSRNRRRAAALSSHAFLSHGDEVMIEANQIREHMEIVGADDHHLGKVDQVMGQDIKLTKAMAVGPHHLIPLSWVSRVDEKVHLTLTAEEAKKGWRELH